jgi:hypothetical protein
MKMIAIIKLGMMLKWKRWHMIERWKKQHKKIKRFKLKVKNKMRMRKKAIRMIKETMSMLRMLRMI